MPGWVCELAASGKLEELQLLIENGISPNVKVRCLAGGHDMSCLASNPASSVTAMGETHALMLQRPCAISAQDYDEKTPLHLAAFGGHYHVVQYLMKRGSVVNETDRDGKTPMQVV